MRRNNRFGRLAMILLLGTALVMSACGSTNSDSKGKTKENEQEKQAEEAGKAEETETITLTVFDKNSGDDVFTDAVAQKIMEETGVQIVVEDPTSSPEKRLGIMLSNRDYPDMILMEQGEMVNRYIEAGALIKLDDLIEEYGSDIQEMYGDILNRSRYTDGFIYWLSNWYGKDTDASAGVLMRKDLLAEIVGEERANSSEPFTQTEYTEILRKFKEMYPELEGQESIALELNQDSLNYVGTMRGMFGMKLYGIDEEQNLTYLPATESYKTALMYLNQLGQEGLLDQNWIINKTAQWEKILSSGCVFSTWGSYWDTDSINKTLTEKYGEDAQFYCYKVIGDGLTADQTTYNGRNGLGWDAIGITDNCEHPEAAIKVANFLASEEGQYLMLWGVEGEQWEYSNGIHEPLESFIEEWEMDPETTKSRTGVRKWTWFIKNGNGSDGTPYDLTTKYAPDDKTAFANASIAASDYWDTSEMSGLEPPGNAELGLKWQQLETAFDQYFLKIVSAQTTAEAEDQYNKMISEFNNIGLEECEEYITQEYQQRMAEWYQQ